MDYSTSAIDLNPTIVGLLKLEQRLGLDHRYLVWISRERMDMQLTLSCLEVNIAERRQTPNFQRREFDEEPPISCKAFEVNVTLTIYILAHLLDLKVRHIAHTASQSAFVGAWAAELKTLYQTSLWQHLPW